MAVGVITYQPKTRKFGDSGHVSKNVSLLIADPITNSPLKVQKIGVICCKSPSLTNGYLTSMRGTLESVTDDKGWFHTDDMGFYDSDGNIHILERRRNVITYQNHTILPISIEHILKMHPKITKEELIKFVASKVFKLRAECVMIEDFPYLPNGYPNRRAISILAKAYKKVYDKKVYCAEKKTEF
ncbi:4-coumarate--CoA ligase-like 5 [Camponotus floridanus]|uniref:4-coumarate--CoA ligase-like 5 n=1 Tax=Camponotus floridanus TaxID=104421 RepID=E2AQB9_CAMFO|nr:4-coumarate--CoA ligase-like 5 [Camponotus floridanus]